MHPIIIFPLPHLLSDGRHYDKTASKHQHCHDNQKPHLHNQDADDGTGKEGFTVCVKGLMGEVALDISAGAGETKTM